MPPVSLPKTTIADIIQWDVNSWARALTYWDQHVDWKSVGACLELGSQKGGLSLWLALKGKKTICSDLENVKAKAEQLHKNYGVSDLVEYRDIDATQIPYENFFDVIVFKSIIGGIGRNNDIETQRKVFLQIHKALKPGGTLLFAENLVASPLHRRLRKKFVGWGDSWRYVTVPELREFLAPFSSFSLETTGVAATFGRSEGQRRFLAGMDKYLFNAITPDSWKYIAYGVAKK